MPNITGMIQATPAGSVGFHAMPSSPLMSSRKMPGTR